MSRNGWHRESTPLLVRPPQTGDAVFVIGAYNGTVAGLLVDQFPDCRHYLFEPQDWACEQLQQKFGDNPNVQICPFALGDRAGKFQMGLYKTYFCSFMRGSLPLKDLPDTWFTGEMREFGEFMRAEGLDSVYHASLNIEAYERVLIPYWARTGWLAKVKTLGISWHGTHKDKYAIAGPFTWQAEPVAEYGEVRALLEKTHEPILEIDNWETWGRHE